MQACSQQTPLPRRTASVPITPRRSPAASSINNSQASASNVHNIDLLFAHSSARIVSFNAAVSCQLLPWRSPTERTIASGPIRIYKTIPHDIAFLQSGSALRPVLSKSQCWNVDGCGTFCLQIRPGSFWRVEILESSDDKAVKAIEFKNILIKILAYEITTCPFMRTGGFVVQQGAVETLQPTKVWRRPKRIVMGTEVVSGATVVMADSVAQDWGQDISGNDSDTTSLAREDDPNEGAPSSTAVTPRKDGSSTDIALESTKWHDRFSLPLRSPGRNLGFSHSCTAPPQLNGDDAFSTISTPSCTSTPSHSECSSPTNWHTPSQQSQEIRVTKRHHRGLSSISVEIDPPLLSEPPQISPTLSTPTLWSGSESDGSWPETVTPHCLPQNNVVDSAIPTISAIAAPKPRLTRSTSSLVLSGAAGFVGATANFMVVKPSSYIANIMFSIAARLATGAAYSLAERYGSVGFLDSDEEFEHEDDYGVCLGPGREDPWDKGVEGPESV